MISIAFHIQKGGTGKTTMSGNVGYAMSRHRRVLLVDADPQGNLSSWFLTELRYELSDVLEDRVTLEEAVVEVRPNLDLLPTANVGNELRRWAEAHLVQKPYAFVDLIERVDYDVVVFDLGPGMSNLEQTILAGVDEVVAVASAEFFSADGIESFENELERLRRDRRAQFRAEKLVINRFFRNFALHQVYTEQYEKMPYKLYRVGQSTAIADCVPNRQTLFEYDPGNRYTTEIERIAADILEVGVHA